MQFLKQSTASQSRTLGPFLDDTDFKTAETGLTIANTDIKLMVNGAASANKNSGGGTHRVNGFYGVTFDATDTATVGELAVSVVVSGALPVFKTFFVVEEAVYDAIYGASAALAVGSVTGNVAGNVTGSVGSIASGGITSASYAAPTAATYALGILAAGTAQSATSTTLVLASATNFTTDSIPVGGTLIITGGTGLGESRIITAYTNSSDTATVSPAWTTTPDNTSTYVLFAGPPSVSTSLPDVNVASITAGAITSGAYAAGAITASAIAADAIGASELATDAVTEIVNGVLDATDGVESGLTPRQALRIIAAVAAGKVSGAGTATIVFRNAVADSKNRITGTDDSSGNRTAITYDLT